MTPLALSDWHLIELILLFIVDEFVDVDSAELLDSAAFEMLLILWKGSCDLMQDGQCQSPSIARFR